MDLSQGHKAKYQANFRYSLKSEVRPEQYDEMKCGSYEFFDSRCDETMVGVKFNSEDQMIQCWVGYQTEALVEGKPEQTELASPLVLAQTDAMADTESETHARLGSFAELSAEERILLAQTINDAGLTWNADPYLDLYEIDEDDMVAAQTSTHRATKKFNDGS